MAPPSRGLVFVLTSWVVAWPAASIRTGSPDSGWWGTQEALTLRQAARPPTPSGDFAGSERVYRRAPGSRFARSKLQAEETELLQSGRRKSTSSERLRMKLPEMEAQAGIGFSPTIAESFRSNASLIHFQQRLRYFELLLSFGLAGREFGEAVETATADAADTTDQKTGRSVFPAERYSLQVNTGQMIAAEPPTAPASWLAYRVFGNQSLESIGSWLGSRSCAP
jgi:hypothetical protein